jgi:hypothetical protein
MRDELASNSKTHDALALSAHRVPVVRVGDSLRFLAEAIVRSPQRDEYASSLRVEFPTFIPPNFGGESIDLASLNGTYDLPHT